MKTIEANIGFSTNEYSDTPEKVVLEITDKDLLKIDECKELIKKHGLDSIRIDIRGRLFDSDGDEHDFRADVELLIISNYGVYYYAQNKYDAGDQIESEHINELFINQTV